MIVTLLLLFGGMAALGYVIMIGDKDQDNGPMPGR